MRGSDGFSLVEMLVVVAILSVLAVSATLPFSRSRSGVGADAAALVQAADRLRVLAMVSDRPRALAIGAEGWQAETRRDGGWSAEGAPRAFAAARAALPAEGPARLVFLPDGRASGAAFRLDVAEGSVGCALAAGRLGCAAP